MNGASTVKHLTVSLVAGLALGGSLLTAIPAQASDQRPCVSRREFNILFNGPNSRLQALTQRDIERRWEVSGEGFSDPEYAIAGYRPVAYLACAFTTDEVRVVVLYDKTGHGAGMGRVKAGGHRHGHV